MHHLPRAELAVQFRGSMLFWHVRKRGLHTIPVRLASFAGFVRFRPFLHRWILLSSIDDLRE
jgi:hypothetical protein